jgi:hypothetical protein
MKSIAIEISDSTYQKIRYLGSTDVGIAAVALADLHGDVGWLGAAQRSRSHCKKQEWARGLL